MLPKDPPSRPCCAWIPIRLIAGLLLAGLTGLAPGAPAPKPATKIAAKPTAKPSVKSTAKQATQRPPLPAPVPMRLPASTEPLAYTLHLVVDPAQPRHSGEVEIDLKLHQPVPVGGALRLHAKDLSIRAVWLEIGAQRLVGRVQPVDAERVDLRFAKPLPAGRARLGLAFAGTIAEQDVYGLFRQQEAGQWMAATQFEATGARLAFPLFDEPGWKVPWTLSLTVPEALLAVSNMPVASEEPAAPGFKRVRFEATPPLPSYLLAFAVGAFDVRDAGTVAAGHPLPLRFITPRGRMAEADFAAGITGRIVQRLEAYFDLPLPYAKLDSLAIPVTVSFSAMEHPGLITYASTLLLARADEATPSFQRDYVSIAAHELAHQWFGNLVTMAWWDDLWLNESFASWMGDRITAEVMPGWGWQTSLQRARARAMKADRLVSARRIEQPMLTDDDLGNLWDPITYEKGQTVLAMFEAWLGPARFQAGVRRYLQRHAWGSATSADFFNALAVDDPTLPDALRSFTRQPGIPRLSVALLCDGGPPRLQLAQSRLLPLGSAASGAAPPRWHLPLLLRTPAGTSRLLMTEAEATLPLPDATCPAWVLANAGGAGYYRVAYAGNGLALAAAAPGLSTGELLALLDDAQGLHGAGDIDSAALLALVQGVANHPAREVAEAAMALLAGLQPLVPPAQQAAYAQRWQAAFGERARALGWAPRPGDSDDDRLLRTTLLPRLANLGQDALLRSQALQLTRAWLADRQAVGADLRGPVLATAALATGVGDDEPADAGPALFDALLAALRASDNRNEREDLLAALGHFRQPALAERARNLLLDPGIDLRESLRPLLFAQARQPVPRAGALAFVARHHADLVKRLGRDEPAWLPSYFNNGCGAEEGRQIEAAFSQPAPRYLGGQAALARTLEAVRLCSAWQAQQGSGL